MNLNHKQRRILLAATALVLLMGLFPPFVVVRDFGELTYPGRTSSIEYAFIFSPPRGIGSGGYVNLAATQFAAQIVVVVLVGAGGFLLAKD